MVNKASSVLIIALMELEPGIPKHLSRQSETSFPRALVQTASKTEGGKHALVIVFTSICCRLHFKTR